MSVRFTIAHVTSYDYDEAVFVEPLTVRLRPRTDPAQRLETFSIAIDPAPSGITEAEDAEGNVVTSAWFEGQTQRLSIETVTRVETLRTNPFDFVVPDAQALRVPMTYPDGSLDRFRSAGGGARALADEILSESDGDALAFLDRLTKVLHARVEHEIREEGDPRSAAETLALGVGSCRDLAVVFMDAARVAGFAARFVSGYQEAEEVQGERYMHAWPEVFIAGAGWRGYDPALGLAVADRHVAVAAAPSPQGAAPTSGTYRGDAGARMRARISIDTA